MRRALKIVGVNVALTLCILYAIVRVRTGLQEDHCPYDLAYVSADSGIPLEIIHGIGSFRTDRGRRPNLKDVPFDAPGSLRIVTMGDSFTYGDEVTAALAYPSQLADLFRRDGLTNVEVINLANSWHGMGQQLRLWEALGKRFDPAFVLLGPRGFFQERDEQFNHTKGVCPSYLHGRWILDGDDVRWIDPPGEPNARARLAAYDRFVPAWSYLRYDRDAPELLRALVPFGRQVPNPFYYLSTDRDAEARLLHGAFFDRFKSGPAQPLMVQLDQSRVDLALEHGVPAFSLSKRIERFPFRALSGHLSGVGNRMVARVFHDLLRGEPVTIDDLEITAPAPGPAAKGRPLVFFARAEILLHDAHAAWLTYREDDEFWNNPPELSFTADHIQSLLALTSPGSSLLDSVLLPLDHPLRADARVELRVRTDGGEATIALGAPRLLDDAGAIAQLAAAPVVFNGAWKGDVGLDLDVAHAPPGEFRSGALLLDGKRLADLQPERGRTVFLELPRNAVVARPSENDLLDVESLPDSGDVWLAFEGGGTRLAIPIATFRRKTETVPGSLTGLRRVIRPSPADPARAEIHQLPEKPR